MECELCGRKAVKKGRLEGTTVNVCNTCADHCEKIIEYKEPERIHGSRSVIDEIPEISIDPKFSEKIKKARESFSLTREQLAKKIQEKESIIIRLEQNRMRPTERIARKLERVLNIKILGYDVSSTVHKSEPQRELTLGDIVTIRKK